MATPKNATAFTFDSAFFLGATRIASPTLAAGDVKVSINGGAVANITTLTTSQTWGGTTALSAAEMTGGRTLVQFEDQTSPRAWDPFSVTLDYDVRSIDDLATATGQTALQADTDDIQARLPAALVSGRMDSSVGAMAAAVLTAAAIAADAITDAKVAADVTIASVTGAVGSVAGNVGGNVAGSVASVTAVSAGGITAASFAVGAVNATVLDSTAVDEIVAGVLAGIVEGTITLKQATQQILAAAAGKNSGVGTGTVTFRNASDTVNAIVATVDGTNNRTAITRTHT